MNWLQRIFGRGEDKDRDPDAAQHTIFIRSTLDGHQQPCLFIPAESRDPRPLLVYLHPWRHGYDTDSRRWQSEARARDWHFIAPHFRGPNKRPDACASQLARQDVLDAVDWVRRNHAVDIERVYAGGVSGGAHMALVMAAEAPFLWAGISSWCPVTDLAAFYHECVAQDSKAYRHIVKVCGGAPGSSQRVDDELRYRSPLFHMAKTATVPLDINHGIRDGQPKGIGIQHSIHAFNALANAIAENGISDAKTAIVSDAHIQSLCSLLNLQPETEDPSYGRAIYLRRNAGPSRLTLFEGAHEDLPAAACAWLEQQRKL